MAYKGSGVYPEASCTWLPGELGSRVRVYLEEFQDAFDSERRFSKVEQQVKSVQRYRTYGSASVTGPT